MKKHLHTVALFVFITAIACNSQKASSFSSRAQAIVDSVYKSEKLLGIIVGTFNNDERKFYTAGYANLDTKAIFDSATLFEVGSITKTFTAYIVMAVLNEKNINDSSSIINYLPDSVQQNNALSAISFLSLLNHTSGLPRLPENMNLFANNMAPYDDYTASLLFEYLKTCRPQPNGNSSYSNLGAGLAGLLAQSISGKSFDALLNEYILLPFGMAAYDSSIAEKKNKSQGYFMDEFKAPYWKMNVLAAAASLRFSTNELLNYLEKMSSPTNAFSKKIIAKLLEPTANLSSISDGVKVCRGWHLVNQKNKPIIYWHNGGTYGFSSFVAFNPDKKMGVVVATNQFNKNEAIDKLGFLFMKNLIQ